ncbi:hypothetical protein HAX54_037361 [Datura stramonium]|uniref:Uncharacterized protein n=1 Tax=Datura stramonium TaxID=4076 RepID=A0ABS8RMN8_DATST|nr:hypothetical protein [Datura stramonium]
MNDLRPCKVVSKNYIIRENHSPMTSREPPVEALYLIKWSEKEKIDVLDSNKVLNTTAFILKSSTHNEEVAATCPKVSEEGLANGAILNQASANFDIRLAIGNGGLPVHGSFYDEVIPSAQELTQADQHGKPFLPKNRSYLFLAFYWLSKGASQEVSVRDWDRNKFSFVVKSKTSQSPSKPLTSKGAPTRTGKGTKLLSSTSKSSISPSMVLDNTCKRKDPPTLFENDNGQISTEVLCKDETPIPFSVDEVIDGSGATSSTKGDADQYPPLEAQKKKASCFELRQSRDKNDLVPKLGFEGTFTDMFNGIFDEDGATSPSCLEISSPPYHPTSLVNEAKVVVAHVKSSKDPVPSSCLSPLAASNFKPQETISSFKMSYVFKMWDALCDWVTRFSVDSSNNFLKLKEGIILILKEIKGTDAFDISTLEGSINIFFETFEEYDALKSSLSQRMTRECHQKISFPCATEPY